MIVKDPLHQNIYIDDFEKKLIDTPEFQRLRRIKQLGVTYLVYPGATHTRFEHSLGTMQVASRMCDQLGLEADEKEKVRIYGLLHDVGHAAFSHESEKAIESFCGNHEKIGKKKMQTGKLGETLKEKFSKTEIKNLGSGVEEAIIAGDVGADRMDYLLRDAYHIGVSYGAVDVDRILHMLELMEGELVVREKGLEATESLLIGRFMMFSTVYLHKTVRIGSAMLNRGILASIEDGMSAEEFAEGTDELVLEKMQSTPNGGVYARDLLNRNLYKQAYAIEGVLENPKKVEATLSKEAKGQVIVDLPPVLSKPLGIKVLRNGELFPIMEESDLVKSLFLSEEKRKKTLILAPSADRKKVKIAAEKRF